MSKVFTLNEVAAFLWRELQGKEFTEEAILRLLLANYDVGVDQARADAQKLVSDFREQGLLTD
jgi:hypothetical protein